jgi:hypothetical protein
MDRRTEERSAEAQMTSGKLIAADKVEGSSVYNQLKYDDAKGGYVVNIDKRRLETAPSYEDDDFVWTPEYGRTVDKYYGSRSYWD